MSWSTGRASVPVRMQARAEDRELVLRSAAGDSQAFNRLFRRHRSGLHGFLFRRLRCHEAAEDAVTLTFCNAWRARSAFRGDASAKAWLYQIAHRVALDLLRRQRRRPVEDDLTSLDDQRLARTEDLAPDPVACLLNAERACEAETAVRNALALLPGDERLLVHLYYYDDRDYEQISAVLGISPSQVKGRLHRVRGRLRRFLVEG